MQADLAAVWGMQADLAAVWRRQAVTWFMSGECRL